MTVGRITQRMMTASSLDGLQSGLSRLAKVQEQLSTGRIINRPSDNPTGTTSAMRIRSSVSDQAQYARNADDGIGWLTQADSTLDSVTSAITKARDLALAGANTGAMGDTAREASGRPGRGLGLPVGLGLPGLDEAALGVVHDADPAEAVGVGGHAGVV